MTRLGLTIATVLFLSSCGRVADVCPEKAPTGAQLIRRASVVLLAEVHGKRVDVISVLRGNLRGDGKAVELETDLPDGLAIVPLRRVDGQYWAMSECWQAVIPLRWRPEPGLELEELLLSPAPKGKPWPIAADAVSIVESLVGSEETKRRLASMNIDLP